MSANAVIVKKKGRRILAILRPFFVGAIKFQKLTLRARSTSSVLFFVLLSVSKKQKVVLHFDYFAESCGVNEHSGRRFAEDLLNGVAVFL